jgi:hypothetical protein
VSRRHVFLEDFRLMADGDHDVPDAVLGKPHELVLDDWAARDLDHRLGGDRP